MPVITAVIFLGLTLFFVLLSLTRRLSRRLKTFGACAAAISVLCLIFIPAGFVQVRSGEIAVVKVWGQAKRIEGAGLHFRNIVSTGFEKYDIKTQEITEYIEAYSLDAQAMSASVTIQYSILADKAMEIYIKYGTLNVLNERIKAVCLEKTKVVLSLKSAMNLIETRSQLSKAVEEAIRENTAEYYITIERVSLTDITFNDAFETAVESKMIAEQEKLKAQYDKEKAIIVAEQQLEVAKREAESAIEKAKGDASAQIEIAAAQADAIRIKSIEIARMMGFEVSEEGVIVFAGDSSEQDRKVISDYLKYIEYLAAWDGKLPETYVTGADNPGIIINP